ncbi:MAG: hypothetical protein NTU58_02010 [Candidatus Nealsonbacteria bacterium]|nr:hypothetical protein [Candidatus Nealsonbacteria bacterium]
MKKNLLIVSLVLFFSFVLTVNAQSQTLSLDLEAIPASGCSPLNEVDLKVTVSGTAQGNINYKFDCTDNGIWDLEINNSNAAFYTVVNLCDYSSPGNYTAKVRAEREGKTAEDTFQIQASNCNPSAPTVDIKANNSDGPVTIAYNTSANLSWTSGNANSCTASGDWSGSKSTSGSESTGNLTSSKYYTITCSNSGGTAVSNSVWINISGANTGNIFTEKLARNLSDGGAFANLIYADPGELISFSIRVRAENSSLYNVIVTDTLPDKLIYQNNSLQVNGTAVSGNIFSGLNIGDLSSGQEKTITFTAFLAGADKFNSGQNQLVNTALVSSSNNSNSKTATIVVTKTAAAGAATNVNTGITNNLLLDSFFLPLSIALGIVWFFKSYIVRIQDWFYLKRKKYQDYNSKKVLELKIAQIKARDFLKKK